VWGACGGVPAAAPLGRVLRLCRQFRYEKATRAGLLVVQRQRRCARSARSRDLLDLIFDNYLGVFAHGPSSASRYVRPGIALREQAHQSWYRPLLPQQVLVKETQFPGICWRLLVRVPLCSGTP